MKKQSLLWKITHPDLAHHSYVFGTMHVQDLRAFQHVELAKKAILECEAFATEFQLDEADPVVAAAHFRLPNSQTLHDYLTKKQYERIDKFLAKRFNLPLEQFIHQKPMMIMNMLDTLILQKDMQQALDEALFNFAAENEKTLLGLETFERQLEILDKIDIELQAKQLLRVTKNFKAYRKAIEKLTQYYVEANVHQLYKSSKRSMGKLRKLMLYDRNRIMANRIDEINKEQSLFAAIGAAHLSGSKGVLKLLKQKRYKVSIGN